MKCAIYTRKSKATEKGESIEAQINTCKEYMKLSYKIEESDMDVFIDEGFSGKNTKRPKFVELIHRVKNKEYNFVVSYKLDRISRNVCDFADVYSLMQKNGCEYISVDEKFDTSTPVGRAMMYIASVFAQMERETIAQRVSDNMLFLAHTGRWLGGRTPIGYQARRIEVNPAMGINKEYSVLEEDPESIQIIKLIYEKYLDLGSIHAVQKWLYDNRRMLGNHYKFSDFSIKSILTNPVYCTADKDAYHFFKNCEVSIGGEESQFNGTVNLIGYNRHQVKEDGFLKRPIEEWVVAPSFHPALIPGKVWTNVQDRLGVAKEKHPREQGVRNDYALLTGLLYCKKCGAKMHSQPQNSGRGKSANGRFTYICQTRKNYGTNACDCKSLSGLQLDELVRKELLKASDETSDLGQRISELRKIAEAKKESMNQLASLTLELETAKKKMSKLVARMTDDDVDDNMLQMIKEQGKHIGEEIRNLEQAIQDESQRAAKSSDELNVADVVKNSIFDFNQMSDQIPIPRQRDVLKQAISRIDWDGDQIYIFLSGE